MNQSHLEARIRYETHVKRRIRATSVARGKTGNQCAARENGQSVWSAGKRATGVERGKKGNRCGARENGQPVWSAGKRVTIGFASEWLF